MPFQGFQSLFSKKDKPYLFSALLAPKGEDVVDANVQTTQETGSFSLNNIKKQVRLEREF